MGGRRPREPVQHWLMCSCTSFCGPSIRPAGHNSRHPSVVVSACCLQVSGSIPDTDKHHCCSTGRTCLSEILPALSFVCAPLVSFTAPVMTTTHSPVPGVDVYNILAPVCPFGQSAALQSLQHRTRAQLSGAWSTCFGGVSGSRLGVTSAPPESMWPHNLSWYKISPTRNTMSVRSRPTSTRGLGVVGRRAGPFPIPKEDTQVRRSVSGLCSTGFHSSSCRVGH